jgi:hypothetical protein
MFKRFCILLGTLLFSAAACASKPQPVKKPDVPKSEQECVARGGQWILYPMGQFYFCSISAADAGKLCTDSSECEGDCEAVSAASGKPVHGECSLKLINPGGCPKFFEHSKVVSEPCT